MNVSISMNAAEVQEAATTKLKIAANKIKTELDVIFKSKISTLLSESSDSLSFSLLSIAIICSPFQKAYQRVLAI